MLNKLKFLVFKLLFKSNLYIWEIKVSDLESIFDCVIMCLRWYKGLRI